VVRRGPTVIVLILAGGVGIVVGGVLMGITSNTNALCSVFDGAAQALGEVSGAQCTGAAIGNAIGLVFVILGVALLLSGILAGVYARSGRRRQ
jgi:hypothetical protein